ncbi:integrase DNA-binding domain-containing protein [Dorea formicigenerans]|mgnify:FL=1|uniref:integrase DNA-binding domain-containing protein n=1 Tax=Dorea formicigenerans TaxID=39486 RepID=UPI001FA91F9D|nr:integrase DNA-binding domain-containing protein [Dorea formicigenerans]
MGKDLKGKELGKGISQRADGRYIARFTSKTGKRKTLYDFKLNELKRKLREAVYEDEHGLNGNGESITLNAWYVTWTELYKKKTVKMTTIYKNHSYYNARVKNSIGKMYLQDIKTYHVQKFINELIDSGLAHGTVSNIRFMLSDMFDKAVLSEYIRKNPCIGVEMPKEVKKERRVLTREEQEKFFTFASSYIHINVLKFAVTTGCRIGDDDDKIRLNQRKPSKYKGLSRFGPEKNLQRINKFMKERPTFYKKLIQMKENFRFYLRCFYCITKVVILQFNSEKQDRISS